VTASLCGHAQAAGHACASFDRTRQYRWELHRRWGPGDRTVTWVMLDPSVADESADDQTLRRITAFSRHWGFDALAVVNLFSLASTSPTLLGRHPSPVGARTNATIARLAGRSTAVVAAWGADRAAATGLLPSALCLGLTADGSPRHPLYVPSATRPVPYLPALGGVEPGR
jgi:hypothetical protein